MGQIETIDSIVPVAEGGEGPGLRGPADAAWRCSVAYVAVARMRMLAGWLRNRRALRRSRRALERLGEAELRDIGLTRNQALTEYRKSLFIG